MLRISCLFLLLVTLFSCTISSQQKTETPQDFVVEVNDFFEQKDTIVPFDAEAHQSAYLALKQRIRQQRHRFRQQKTSTALRKSYFFHALVDSIFPYWYQTPWDFNGISEKPRQGQIACGYFVSTTLRDLGFKINRYRVAQKAALDILKSFAQPKNIQKFSNFEKMTEYLSQSKENEIFILGLDYHVGFVVRKNQELFFIHSNYFGNSEVEKEVFTESYSAQSSELFYLGSLSENDLLLKKWLVGS